MEMTPRPDPPTSSWIEQLIWFFLKKRILAVLLILGITAAGLYVAPVDRRLFGVPRNPVPLDAVPDIGENQQIVTTQWPGRSPRDVQDQVTYPLTVSLMGLPGVRTVRGLSMFGFSNVYVIFDDGVDFYWARSRLLEKLNSLPRDTLPEGVQPALGPDATALGQVFWYTLEGRDSEGRPTDGWDLEELRSIQDWYVRYALLAVDGVSEVASVGGFVQEYQVDVHPDLLRAHNVTIDQVAAALRRSNTDVGAGTLEYNRVEYVIRGVGFIQDLDDIRLAVVRSAGDTPILVQNVAHVSLGPAPRRGALWKDGREAVGGVVVVRYGENPLAVINRVHQKIEEISPGLPRKTLADGRVSRVAIVPFYDRTGLIHETLGTLRSALTNEILVTVIVVMVMVAHLGSSLLVSGLLPLAVLFCFVLMKLFRVEANLVALSGIAIAIGTMVDMGIILTENILRHLDRAEPGEDRRLIIHRAAGEVSGAVLTAVATTVVGFLPVFALQGAEGKLFRPLAFTKTFALVATVTVALTVIPPLAHAFLRRRGSGDPRRWIVHEGLIYLGLALAVLYRWWLGLPLAILGACHLAARRRPGFRRSFLPWIDTLAPLAVVGLLLSHHWMPLGPDKGLFSNALFIFLLVGLVLGFFRIFHRNYERVLRWALDHKRRFLALPVFMVFTGALVWFGFSSVFGWLPKGLHQVPPLSVFSRVFPGLGEEFMPPLDEGSYLYMPTTMAHASIGEVLDILDRQDRALRAIPEVETAVGKLGRAESALDPAPVSMIETVVNYRSEYLTDRDGDLLLFRCFPDEVDFFRNEAGILVPAPDGKPYRVRGRFARDQNHRLIPDPGGAPFRLWRPPLDPALNPGREFWSGIRNPDDIWKAITRAAAVPGTTSAPKLQPISARLVMLQSGIRAPMGIRVSGPDLDTIERVSMDLERYLRHVPSIEAGTVIADRIVGKPYLEIKIDRERLARYGLDVAQVQGVIETAVGGKPVTTTVEGRERYGVRVRYMRELIENPEALSGVLVPAPGNVRIPLGQLAAVDYAPGPQMIKSEDTFLVGYVLFDKKAGVSEVRAVEDAKDYLDAKMASGELVVPPGVNFSFTGSYENKVRAEKTLSVVIPLALFIIFLILYLQFNEAATTALVFSGIAVAWAGGFIMIWLYGLPWFLDFELLGVNMRHLFQVHPIHLSVAVWVGFLALFGIASDDGVVMATYLESTFAEKSPQSVEDIRATTVEAALRRVRPCLMTTATTLLALIPVLTSRGRGADLMIPMAIPSFGGMALEVITMLVVPVLYCALKEKRLRRESRP